MAVGNELIIKGRVDGKDVEQSIKNINPETPVAVLRQVANNFNNLTTVTLVQIVYRQDVDITNE